MEYIITMILILYDMHLAVSDLGTNSQLNSLDDHKQLAAAIMLMLIVVTPDHSVSRHLN